MCVALCILVACSPNELGERDASADTSLADTGRMDAGDVRDAGGFDAPDSVDAGSDVGAMDAGMLGSGGEFPGRQTRTVGAGGASFDYALYLPTSYAPGVATPMLAVLHGQGDTGANMRDFWQATSEREGFIVLATTATGSSGGWSPGADFPRFEVALNDALTAYAVDEGRLYVWGFSAGAHVTHGLALGNADVFAAYAVSAGALQSFAGPSAPRDAIRRIPVSIHIGTDDPLFPFATMDRDAFVAAGWRDGADLAFVQFAGGHTVRPDQLAEIWTFLSPHRLPR